MVSHICARLREVHRVLGLFPIGHPELARVVVYDLFSKPGTYTGPTVDTNDRSVDVAGCIRRKEEDDSYDFLRLPSSRKG